jgi:hypothetical protein
MIDCKVTLGLFGVLGIESGLLRGLLLSTPPSGS